MTERIVAVILVALFVAIELVSSCGARTNGPTFVELPDGTISTQADIELDNDSSEARRFTIALVGTPEAMLRTPRVWNIEGHDSIVVRLVVDTPRERFRDGRRNIHLQITSGDGFHRVVRLQVPGPADPR